MTAASSRIKLLRARGGAPPAPPPSGYLPETLAVVASWVTDPGSTRKDLLDTCISSLIGANVWNKLDALYLWAGHQNTGAGTPSDDSHINIRSPGLYNSILNNSGSWTEDRGWQMTATASWLSAGWNIGTRIGAGSQFQRDSHHLMSYCNFVAPGQDISSTLAHHGNTSGSGSFIFTRPWNAANFDTRLHSTNASAFAWSPTTPTRRGCFIASREGATLSRGYFNGTQLGVDSAAASTITPSGELVFLRWNVTYNLNDRLGAVSFGAALTPTEAAALHSAVHAYMTAIGGNY